MLNIPSSPSVFLLQAQEALCYQDHGRLIALTCLLVGLFRVSDICAEECGESYVSCWRQMAERGDAKAQYMIGLAYYTGTGVPQDYKQAVSWYRKAAEQGYAPPLGVID